MSSPTKKASEAAAQLVADWDDQNAELEPSLKDMQRLALAIDAHTDAALASRGAVNAELLRVVEFFADCLAQRNVNPAQRNVAAFREKWGVPIEESLDEFSARIVRAALSRASQQPQQQGAGQPPATTGAEGGGERYVLGEGYGVGKGILSDGPNIGAFAWVGLTAGPGDGRACPLTFPSESLSRILDGKLTSDKPRRRFRLVLEVIPAAETARTEGGEG